MGEKYRTLSAVMLMLSRTDENGEEEILLQKRMNTGYMDGYWDFSASGHVEDNEPMTTATVREAKEEIGVDVKIEDLEPMTVIHKNTGKIYYNGYFKTTKWQGEPIVNEPEKCEEIKWFKIKDLPENVIADRVQAIKNYENNICYSEFGWEVKEK